MVEVNRPVGRVDDLVEQIWAAQSGAPVRYAVTTPFINSLSRFGIGLVNGVLLRKQQMSTDWLRGRPD